MEYFIGISILVSMFFYFKNMRKLNLKTDESGNSLSIEGKYGQKLILEKSSLVGEKSIWIKIGAESVLLDEFQTKYLAKKLNKK